MILTNIKTVSAAHNTESCKRIIRFGSIGLLVMVLNAAMNFKRLISVSAWLVLLMALALSIILIIAYKGYAKAAIAGIVFTLNPLLVAISYAEGLQTGAYLFILPLMFALAFLIGNIKIAVAEMAAYFIVTACSFCICVLLSNQTSHWQYISGALSAQMFKFNCFTVIILSALFAYIGVYFERQYADAILAEKNKAELQEKKIDGQNKYLEEIAFVSSHIIRAPLTNILALTAMMDAEKITNLAHKEIVQHLQASAQQLDEAINSMVKTQ